MAATTNPTAKAIERYVEILFVLFLDHTRILRSYQFSNFGNSISDS